MALITTISVWGNYPKHDAEVLTPLSLEAVQKEIRQKGTLIAR